MFFAIKKLEKLKPELRIRKIIQILLSCEKEVCNNRVSSGYLVQAVKTVLPSLDETNRGEADRLIEMLPETLNNDDSVLINRLRHIFLSFTGKEPAEWDLVMAGRENSETYAAREKKGGPLFPVNVYLDDIRSPFNLGSVFRTAEAFCFSSVILSPRCPSPLHTRAKRSSMGTIEKVPWTVQDISSLTGSVFALELGGEMIDDFEFPESGTVIIGSEETGVSKEGLKKAGESCGIVSIPVYSSRISLNAGVAFGILACSWITRLK